jgi:carbon monoxide dehydrogenase subunit G
MAELVLTQDVDAPAEQVWEALTDWAAHDRWMLLTRAEGDRAEGGEIRAFTGIGRLGFLDTMTITVWEPPRRAVVRHTGKVVRGSGAFEVEDLGAARSRVVWSEWVLLPLGAIGQLVWPVARIPLRVLLQVSLRRLARYVVTQP